MVTPIEYEGDVKNLTGFTKSKISLVEKLKNRALETHTQAHYMNQYRIRPMMPYGITRPQYVT